MSQAHLAIKVQKQKNFPESLKKLILEIAIFSFKVPYILEALRCVNPNPPGPCVYHTYMIQTMQCTLRGSAGAFHLYRNWC